MHAKLILAPERAMVLSDVHDVYLTIPSLLFLGSKGIFDAADSRQVFLNTVDHGLLLQALGTSTFGSGSLRELDQWATSFRGPVSMAFHTWNQGSVLGLTMPL